MRCPNPDCRARVEPGDRFCPRCGTDLTAAAPAPVPEPRQASQQPAVGPRISEEAVPRRPVPTKDEAYPALRSYSALMIKTGSVLKWIFIAMGIFHFINGLRLAVTHSDFSEAVGGILRLAIYAASGWLTWLFLSMLGELVYLILDVANTFISSASRQWRRGDGR